MKKVRWWDKIFNFFEDFEPKLKVSVRWVEMIILLVLSRLIVNNNASILELSVNPFGMFRHLGNLVSVPYALLGTFIVCCVAAKLFVRDLKIAKIILFVSALLTGLIVNTVAETGSGMSAIGLPNTGDPLDVLWGTLFCLAACLVSLRVQQRKDSKATL